MDELGQDFAVQVRRILALKIGTSIGEMQLAPHDGFDDRLRMLGYKLRQEPVGLRLIRR